MRARTPADLGGIARLRRERLGLSQGQLCGRARVTRQWLSRFENGVGEAGLGKTLRVLDVLGLVAEVTPRDERDDPGEELLTASARARIDAEIAARARALRCADPGALVPDDVRRMLRALAAPPPAPTPATATGGTPSTSHGASETPTAHGTHGPARPDPEPEPERDPAPDPDGRAGDA